MKKVWKWVLGIVIVLLVVAALVAVPFAMRRFMLTNTAANSLPQARGWNGGPMLRGNDGQFPQYRGGGNFGNRRMPMFGGGPGFRRGFGMGFFFFGWILRLIGLALIVLLIFGIYQLGKRSGMRSVQDQAAPTNTPTPTQRAENELQDNGTLTS